MITFIELVKPRAGGCVVGDRGEVVPESDLGIYDACVRMDRTGRELFLFADEFMVVPR